MYAGKLSQVYARPLIPVLSALMAGIVSGVWFAGPSGLGPPVALFAVLPVILVSKRKRAALLPLVLFFGLGCWSVQSWSSPSLPVNHVSRFIDDKPWHIVGELAGHVEQFPDRTRFDLKVETLARGGASYQAGGLVRVTVLEPHKGLLAGDRLGLQARLSAVRNFNNPGRFDYRRYLAFRGILASASVPRKDLVIKMGPARGFRFDRAIGRLREAVARLIDRATSEEAARQETGQGPEPAPRAGNEISGLINALIAGDRSGVSPNMRDAFNRIGAGHLLAISGLHVGMVATLAFFCLRYLLSRSQRVLLAAWAAKGAAVLSLLPVLFYGFLAGMSPSTQRAVIMVALFLAAMVFEKERDDFNTLAFAAFVILTISPWALFEASFQLSFIAVFSILYALRHTPLAVQLKEGSNRYYRRLVLFLLVSISATLGTLPLTLYHFNQISIIGIFANCIMVPLVGFLVVPLGLTAIFFLPVSEIISISMMKVSAAIMELGVRLAFFMSGWPFAAARTVTPTLIEAALFYSLLWAALNFRRIRRRRSVAVVLALVVLIDVAYWINERYCRKDLRLTAIDVRQGSSTLIEFPAGPCMLVDGGGFYDNRFDVGAMVVAPFLWKKKIGAIDVVVLTHDHPDHLNGLLSIVRDFNVKEVWMMSWRPATESYNDLLQIITHKGIRMRGPQGLAMAQTINGVQIQALYPPADFWKRRTPGARRNANNCSIVLKISFKDVSFLLPGDIEAEAETELISLACSTLKSNVLFSPHHGSGKSSTPAFLRCVNPDVAVISSGTDNIFRFPHRDILERYHANGYRIFRTDRHGAIAMTTDGAGLSIEPFLAPGAGSDGHNIFHAGMVPAAGTMRR